MSERPIPMTPGCCDDFDPESLSVAAALVRIEQEVRPVSGVERVPVRSALGRVLAGAIVSPVDVPAHTNSAMDGYACIAADLPDAADGVVELEVAGTALAGAPFRGEVCSGQAVRIMTGAVMPPGTDCVVMQERAERLEDRVRIGGGNRPGQNIRLAGEDLARGAQVLPPGRLLTPADLGLVASLGIGEVAVRRRLRVAFFSTGDELRSIGEPLDEGDIYDSNRYTLHAMLSRMGVEMVDMGVVGDDRDALGAAFREAAACADAVITSGGVSVGEADYTRDILTMLGQVNFWKIAMKPGRPLAFGRLGGALFFGLPGNPVSVMVTFYQFVQPALWRMMGREAVLRPTFPVPSADRLRKRPGRLEYQRGILMHDDAGRLVVRGTGDQGSGILSTMSRANCFIILDELSTGVEAGEPVQVQPFEGLT